MTTDFLDLKAIHSSTAQCRLQRGPDYPFPIKELHNAGYHNYDTGKVMYPLLYIQCTIQ